MTVEELRREAKALGYNIIRINPMEKLLPCVCGCKRRFHWTTHDKYGGELVVLRCERCPREASGKTERDARHNWNEMVREAQEDGQTN